MKEALNIGIPPKDFPDPRESSPEEFASACIIVFREEGKKMIGHGVFIESTQGRGDPPDFLRVELDRDHSQVIRIVRESDQSTIPLESQKGRRIVRELQETKFWTEIDGQGLRFQRAEQPARV